MVVCFIGHRTIENAEIVEKALVSTLPPLIEQGADTFLFGSRSEFNFLSWKVITDLQITYPHIKRVNFTAPHETSFTSKEEREEFERIASKLTQKAVRMTDYEETTPSLLSTNATRDTYIMRNQEMIDRSDVCIFYYNENYLPPQRKLSKRNLSVLQPKSGTAIAYKYAKRKKKQIINIYSSNQ